MPGYGAAFGRGLLLGAGAALVYAVARDAMAPARERPPRDERDRPSDALAQGPAPSHLIDWDWATRIAIRTAGRTPTLHPAAQAHLQAQYEDLLREIEQPIAQYTHNDLSLANTQVQVLDRADWIRANMANFRYLLQPVEDFYLETLGRQRFGPPPGFQQAARMMLGSQIGILVGYLARRVLGQYDIALMAAEPVTAGKLYFVEPNLQMVERSLAVPPDEFRRWIALHEATHAHEFELYPWVREYLNNSLRQYLRLLMDDMRGRGAENTLLSLINRFIANLRRGETGINALMTPQQRELMSRLQGLMALAEGYSNHVMNQVGKDLLPHFDMIHERVEHRQKQRSQAEELFLKITGLSLKMEQYRLGEQFVDEVARQRSVAFVNQAWQSAESLPTESEIRNPGQWIARMEAMHAG